MWLWRQEGLPTNLARVYAPKGLTPFHVFTNAPYADKSLGRNQPPKKNLEVRCKGTGSLQDLRHLQRLGALPANSELRVGKQPGLSLGSHI